MFKHLRSIYAAAAAALILIPGVLVPCYALDSDPTLSQDLKSDNVIVIDADSGQILTEKNPDDRIYPASMTKMMTALIAIEMIQDPNETITITKEMLAGLQEANASVAGFVAGDAPTMIDILYGIALPSGADASNAMAYHFAGGVAPYVEKMNAKAKELGMNDTHFVNTTGLHNDDHYSTVRDIAKLLKYCLGHDTFRTIFSSAEYTTSPLRSHPAGIKMESTAFSAIKKGNYPVPGFVGAKTGYTGPAGHCMAYWTSNNGMNLICVTAHAATGMYVPSHITDASSLLVKLDEWEKRTLLTAGDTAAKITVHHAHEDETITIQVPDTLIADLPKASVTEVVQTFPAEVNSGIEPEDMQGTLAVVKDGQVIYQKDLMVQIPREVSFWSRLWMRIRKMIGF
ncbi:MAG: D-alanyl-D-alanine carboxypeptidase [Solobacterium sp.]|nr:D-alanyl-D-alanine carboxypeptidase [Solobacterium sp.]